ncbi:MAG: murein biosynthesis integral membrane protein MurJ [Candidatus Paceibacterota bacterium]
MVKKVLSLLHKEITGLHQAAYLLGLFALSSQVLALIRDRILAAQFGAGNILDLYYAAFRIPDFIFVTVASLVSISVLIPYLIEQFQKSEEEAKEFINQIFTFFFLVIVSISALVFILTPFLLRFIFPSFASEDSFSDLVMLSRILLLSPIFLGFSNLLASITQINNRFFIYAISPILYNVGIIAGIVVLYPIMGLTGLVWGVVIGAVLHFGVQMPFVIQKKLLPTLSFPLRLDLVRKVVFNSVPRTIAVSSNEIAQLFLISFASFLAVGSISIFNFSFHLQSVPFSIIGVSYSLAAFPALTRLFSSGNIDKFLEQMIVSSRHIIFWSVPVSVMFVVLRAQIVRTILGAGKFGWSDTRLTAAALALFTISLIAQNMSTLFVKSYYSRGKTKIPLIINVISAFIIVIVSYGLVYVFNNDFFFRDFMESLLKVSDIPGTVVLMLPLGFSFGVIINAVVHWIAFHLEFKEYSKPVLRTLFQISGSSTIMGFVAYKFLDVFDDIFNLETLRGIFFQGFFSGIIGISTGVIVLYLLKSTELREVWKTLHKKIWKAKIVGPDAEL